MLKLSIVDPKTRTRSHAGRAYYEPVAGRRNLHVLTEALVEKVVFKSSKRHETLVASGLKFRAQGKNYVVKAMKEVILSAGAFESSKILELSGIGSAKILKEKNITVLYENRNVGENLQDHPMIPLGFEVADGQFTSDAFRLNVDLFNAALATYVANHTGPLSGPLSSSALLSYQQIQPASNKNKIPKGIDNILTPEQAASNPGLAHQLALTRRKTLDPKEATAQELVLPAGTTPGETEMVKLWSSTGPGSYLSIFGVLEHPFSRGSVHIASSDPQVYPLIDPNYLGETVDLEIFADILLHLQAVARTEPLASLLKGKGHVYQPGSYELDESNVRAYIKKALSSEYHPIGTCSMLPRHKGGVVNERLRAYGTKNLRVVDASIFPLHVRANSEFLGFPLLFVFASTSW